MERLRRTDRPGDPSWLDIARWETEGGATPEGHPPQRRGDGIDRQERAVAPQPRPPARLQESAWPHP